MADRDPRLSAPTLKVLKFLLAANSAEASGAAISKATGVGAGTLYPLLARLEKAKWIEGNWEKIDPKEEGRPKRRFYNLTGIGVTRARSALSELQMPNLIGAPSWNG
ncbi:PadR family transcriptional regulator [Methylobacterium sp. D48H]